MLQINTQHLWLYLVTIYRIIFVFSTKGRRKLNYSQFSDLLDIFWILQVIIQFIIIIIHRWHYLCTDVWEWIYFFGKRTLDNIFELSSRIILIVRHWSLKTSLFLLSQLNMFHIAAQDENLHCMLVSLSLNPNTVRWSRISNSFVYCH